MIRLTSKCGPDTGPVRNARRAEARAYIAAWLLGSLLACHVPAAFADRVIFSVDGHINLKNVFPGRPDLSEEEAFHATATVDTSVPDELPETPEDAEYRVLTASFTLAGRTWRSIESYGRVGIIDAIGTGNDQIGVFGGYFEYGGPHDNPTLGGAYLNDFVVYVNASGADALTSDAIPLDPISPGTFLHWDMFAEFNDLSEWYWIRGVVDSFSSRVQVSEPASIMLVGVALLLLSCSRARAVPRPYASVSG